MHLRLLDPYSSEKSEPIDVNRVSIFVEKSVDQHLSCQVEQDAWFALVLEAKCEEGFIFNLNSIVVAFAFLVKTISACLTCLVQSAESSYILLYTKKSVEEFWIFWIASGGKLLLKKNIKQNGPEGIVVMTWAVIP